jgi:hypothetical protein
VVAAEYQKNDNLNAKITSACSPACTLPKSGKWNGKLTTHHTAQKKQKKTRVKYAQQKYTQLFTGNTPKYTNWAYFRPFLRDKYTELVYFPWTCSCCAET